jgi:hypothetical protein
MQGKLMSRYFSVVVLIVFGCVLNGTAQEKPRHMPVIDCVVEYTNDYADTYTPPDISDTITLDLNAIDKISLQFEMPDGPRLRNEVLGMGQDANSPAVLSRFRRRFMGGRRFRVESVDKPNLLDWMKLVSSEPDWERVTIYISRLAATVEQPHQHYDITIITEGSLLGYVGVLVLKGTARD